MAICSLLANAQDISRDYNFVEIKNDNPKILDISCVEPESFTQIDAPHTIWYPSLTLGNNVHVGISYSKVLMSDDKNCLILFPELRYPPILGVEQGVVDELRWNAGDLKKDVGGDYREIRLKNMSNYCNADAVFIAEYEQVQPFFEGYNHCIRIAMEKYAHPGVSAWLLLTDDGVKDKDKYLRMLLDNISYGDTPSYLLKLHAVSGWAFQYRWIPPKNKYSTVVRGYTLRNK